MGAAAAEPERAVQTTKKPISLGTSPHESFPDKLPGEDEFLRGEFGAALPPLISAFYQGDIRGAFYARIIYENGLDGRAPNPGEAGRALSMLTLKYKEILRLAREAPRSKRALYQTALGLLYFRGLVPGSERDLKAAKAWAKVAADDDFGPAMNLMAAISCEPVPPKILFGLWTPSHKDCFTWTMDAAETGDILAIANLSYLYREGVGVDMDPLMAVNWAHNAVKRDPPSARAQNDMGAYYLLGVGVTRDPEEARRWFAMAQSRYPLAAQNLGRLGTSDPLVENRVAY
jgi:TPR repeat protein